ncbi:MAG TPA: squalene synthase HpnC [Blastocatellia bacterium]|nr:squalene synthase HpnC [Blastocatellia bacterium]
MARSHYENFPVGSLLVPRRLRKHVWAIYAFARVADDFADESYDGNAVMHAQSERLECLARWRDLLLSCYRHRPSHPVFIALADTASSFDLPVALFDDLLSAFTQDVVKTSYADFAELMDYCRRSANPIGRLMLLLFGRREQELQLYSDSICTALQLTNHWQDVSIDLDKGRVYLPESDLKQHGLCTNDLRQAAGTERFRDLMHLQTGRTREMFELGKPLCRLLTGRFGLELRAIWLGGTTILSRIEQNGYDVFRHRPTLRFSDKLRILTRAFSRRGFHSQ